MTDNNTDTNDSFEALIELLDAEPGEVSELVAASVVDGLGRAELDPCVTPEDAIRESHRGTVAFLLEAIETIDGDVTLDELRSTQESIMGVSGEAIEDSSIEHSEAGIDRDSLRGFY